MNKAFTSKMKTQRQLLLVVLLAMVVTSCRKSKEEAATPAPPTGGGFVECPEFVIDIDENEYPVVRIGNQCWMAANLKTTKYRDGVTIPNVTEINSWLDMSIGAWCNYENNGDYDAVYGKLYNWYAAANPSICPQGWHVPGDEEWKQLEQALGMSVSEVNSSGGGERGEGANVGGKMKTSYLWIEPNIGAANESGFSGLPGGIRTYGSFAFLAVSGYWWSASESGAEYAWRRALYNGSAGIDRFSASLKSGGQCIRCVKN
jgi:uncharacterized protein (TIGR02145 family)